MAKLEIDDVRVSFGDVVAVDRVSLQVGEGETVVLLGPSGCGKTTLLRLVAGFNHPQSGSVRISGRTVASPTVMVPPEKRSLSMVFQSYAVWPHKTVFENLAYGLRLRRINAATISAKVTEALATVRMEPYAGRFPGELSGGQQQRVALARALVLEPEILLFDEPLSNLDASLREHMRFEIKALLSKLGITSIYVTHDQNEAMVVADRIAVMNRGRIEQLGSPEDVYYRSRTEFVAQFIGLANVLDATIIGDAGDGQLRVNVERLGELQARSGGAEKSDRSPQDISSQGMSAQSKASVRLFVRPEHIELSPVPKPGLNVLRGKVSRRSFVGAQTDYIVDVNGVSLRVINRSPSSDSRSGDSRSGDSHQGDFQPGQDVMLSFAPADCKLLAG